VDADGETLVIKRPYEPEYERLKGLELTVTQHDLFVQECKRAGLVPLTTAFNLTCIPEIRKLGWRSVKVASYDCGSLPLITALADSFEELIVSTGATFDEEIEVTAKFLNERKIRHTLLHCVTIYPTPLKAMHLNRLQYLRGLTSSVGLSNHSLTAQDGVKADMVALYLGADVIERHFTVLPPDQTRDGKVSITKDHLRQIVDFAAMDSDAQRDYITRNIPEYEEMLGQRTRLLSHAELLNRAYYRGRFCNRIEGRQIFNWEQDVRRACGV
jgi:sialic acid synthase SpsE